MQDMQRTFRYAKKRISKRYYRQHVENIVPYADAEKIPLKYNEEWNFFIGKDGAIYTPQENGLLIRKLTTNHRGYLHVSIDFHGKSKTFRVNRLVAQHWIPNPDNLPVVGHHNNIKTDNRVENLYWTTYKENSQKALADGLMEQDSGFADSQSMPVACYDKETGEVSIYGSRRLASKATGASVSTVSRHVNEVAKTKKRGRYIFADYKRYLKEGMEVFVL